MKDSTLATGAARSAIEAGIPHRDPFLFVDAILERGEDSLQTGWHVPLDAPWFRGHYPDQPILPGVLISEHAIQSGALLVSFLEGGLDTQKGIPVLTKIEGARFKRIVLPGEELTTRVSLRERLGPAYYLSGQTACEGNTVLRMRFVLTVTSAPE